MFAERSGKIDWARYVFHCCSYLSVQTKLTTAMSIVVATISIMRLDLRRVVEERDIQALSDQLMNITYTKLDPRDLKAATEAQLIQLFELAQLTIEYVVSVQLSLKDNETELQRMVNEART